MSETNENGYSAADLKVLEGLDAVRKRPGMYIGSTDGRGLQHLVWEIVDNAVDEALAGFCTRIEVVLHADGSVEVADNGRGIPTDTNPQTGLSGVELVFTKLHAGGKFGEAGYKVSGGLHGVGASVVNALSERLDVTVDRDGTRHVMTFGHGVPGVFENGVFTEKPGLRKTDEKPTSSGTTVRFFPDRTLFTDDAVIDRDRLVDRAKTTVALVHGLTIAITDRRGTEPSTEEFSSENGLSQLVSDLAAKPLLHEPLLLTGEGTFTEQVPVVSDDGTLVVSEVERSMSVEVALGWTSGYETTVRSFANIVATSGGTHVTGFERAVVRTVGKLASELKVLRAGEDRPTKDDVLEGMVAAVSVLLPEPQFEGQTKERLGTPAAAKIVADVVGSELDRLLRMRANKKTARAVCSKVASAARTRRQLRTQREAMRRKRALETSSLPAKLVDCRSDQVEETELFIVEGDSAMGTAKAARDATTQALLPIRGKILNTWRASEHQMLKNAECGAIISAFGAGAGKTFDLSQIRYGRLILLADADVDGAHIRTLLLTFVFRYMRPLLAEGRVFAAVPPLHQIVVASSKTPIYTYSEEEMSETIGKLETAGKKVKEVQRYKGLGEMSADQLAETTMDRNRRQLRRITLSDAERAQAAFARLMGKDVEARRVFIAERALDVDSAALDV